MPAPERTAAGGFDIDRANFTIRFERRLDAMPAAVFDAWT